MVRKTGEEWLVTMADTEAHIPDVYEEVLGVVDITTLNSCQYCVICDPVDSSGKPQLGQKKVIKVRLCPGPGCAAGCLGTLAELPKASGQSYTHNDGRSPYTC